MELVVVSIGVLVALVIAAAIIDLRARRFRRRISVDPDAVLDARRRNSSRDDLYGSHGGGF
jgi:hypothetical protein